MADWSDLVLCPECGAANPHDGVACVRCEVNLPDAVARAEAAREQRLAKMKSKKPRRVGSRDCMPVGELTIADLQRNPVWEYDLANEAEHDETWVKPVKAIPVSDLSNRIVGTEAVLACGATIHCDLGNISLNSATQTKHFLALSVYGEDDKTFQLARYFDTDYDSSGPQALADFLGRPLEEVFPISYDISKVASGLPDVIKATIPASPSEKLTRQQIMRLVMEAPAPTSVSESPALDAAAHAVEMTTILNEMTTVLNAVTDEESAQAAAPKITALFRAYDEAGAKWGVATTAALGEAVAGKAEALSDYAQDYAQKEKERHAAVETFGAAMERVRNLPAAQAHLGPVFDRRGAME
jgi:hypothetical protein